MSSIRGSDTVDGVIVRLLRIRTELKARRAESLRYLAKHRGHLERLLSEVPAESLTADERVTLRELVTRLK